MDKQPRGVGFTTRMMGRIVAWMCDDKENKACIIVAKNPRHGREICMSVRLALGQLGLTGKQVYYCTPGQLEEWQRGRNLPVFTDNSTYC